MATLSTFFDMVYVYATETSGHGPFTLGAAVGGFQTAAAAGITNGTPVSYRATDGTNWETAHGVIDVSGSTYTLTRGVDTIKSSNSNSLVSFGSGVTVAITELSQDLNMLVSAGAAQSFTATQKIIAQTNIGVANLLASAISSTNFSTASTTYTAVTGMTISFTAPASGEVVATFSFPCSNSVADSAVFALWLSGTQYTSAIAVYAATDSGTISVTVPITGLTSGGSYTVALYCKANAGQTVSISCSSVMNGSMVIMAG